MSTTLLLGIKESVRRDVPLAYRNRLEKEGILRAYVPPEKLCKFFGYEYSLYNLSFCLTNLESCFDTPRIMYEDDEVGNYLLSIGYHSVLDFMINSEDIFCRNSVISIHEGTSKLSIAKMLYWFTRPVQIVCTHKNIRAKALADVGGRQMAWAMSMYWHNNPFNQKMDVELPDESISLLRTLNDVLADISNGYNHIYPDLKPLTDKQLNKILQNNHAKYRAYKEKCEAEAAQIREEIEEHRRRCREIEELREARMAAYDRACDRAGCALSGAGFFY